MTTRMNKARINKGLATLLAAATIAVSLSAATTDASAYCRRGWGWGPGIAAGVIAGAVVAGAIVASRPAGYVVYPGYAQPVSGPGCYWASQPLYDQWGRVVGYSGQPIQVCPGYAEPAAAPPPVALPPK